MTEAKPGGPGSLVAILLAAAGIVILGVTLRQELIAKRLQAVDARVIIPAGKSVNAGEFLSNGRNGGSRAPSWNVSIRYEYAVDGNAYRGHLVGLNGNSFGSQEDALASLQSLKSDGSVPAWYDKDQPGIAFLDPKPRRGGYLGGSACLLLAFGINRYLNRIYHWLRSKQ